MTNLFLSSTDLFGGEVVPKGGGAALYCLVSFHIPLANAWQASYRHFYQLPQSSSAVQS